MTIHDMIRVGVSIHVSIQDRIGNCVSIQESVSDGVCPYMGTK